MKQLVCALLYAMVVATTSVATQTRLMLNEPVSRQLAPGVTHSFLWNLAAEDYATGSITQNGRVTIAVYRPDGQLLRRFPAPPADGKRSFAFVAELRGAYRLDVLADGNATATYELVVEGTLSVAERLRPDETGLFSSPRIEALRKRVAAGDTNTEPFWREVAEAGTPMVEPFGKTGSYQLVTFLWRGNSETRNVLVLGSFQGTGGDLENVMRRLPNTDVWYLTLRLQAGSRFTYQVSPNDPLTFDGPRANQRTSTLQVDPLNRNRIFCPPSVSKFVCTNAVELPGAATQPWIAERTSSPKGKVADFEVPSAIQALTRPISVYTPAGYRADGPANALVVLFDRQIYLSPEFATATILDNLIADSRILPAVVVFVANVGNRRTLDLAPSSNFDAFIAKELVPWVQQRYNVTKDPALMVVGGASLGGLEAAYIGLRHSDVFGNVLSQSGALWWSPDYNGGPDSRPGEPTIEQNWLAKQFIASPKLPLNWYLDAGTFEAPRGPEVVRILINTRHFRDVLLAKGYRVRYQQFAGGHDSISWRGTLPDALMGLLGKH